MSTKFREPTVGSLFYIYSRNLISVFDRMCERRKLKMNVTDK